MKVGSFSPRVSHNLHSFERKSTATADAGRGIVPPAPQLNTAVPRDGFEVKGGARTGGLRRQGDSFQTGTIKPSQLLEMSGNTSISKLTNLFKSGQLQAPSALPSQLEPLKGSLDGITQKTVDDTSLDNLGKMRRSVLTDLKQLGLKGRLLAKAAQQVMYDSICGKAGPIGTQWAPGD